MGKSATESHPGSCFGSRLSPSPCMEELKSIGTYSCATAKQALGHGQGYCMLLDSFGRVARAAHMATRVLENTVL